MTVVSCMLVGNIFLPIHILQESHKAVSVLVWLYAEHVVQPFKTSRMGPSIIAARPAGTVHS